MRRSSPTAARADSGSPARRVPLALVLLVALSSGLSGGLGPTPAAAAAAPETGLPAELAGLPLEEALRLLEARGLRLLYTSELVRPEMRVETAPATGDPRTALGEILAPHGLAAREVAGGVLVVVAAPVAAATPAPASVAGRVTARGARRGLAGAVVTVVGVGGSGAAPGREIVVGADGAFVASELPPGPYRVEARAEGYLATRVDEVPLAPGAARRIDFRLQPQPFVEEEIVVQPSRLTLLHERPDSTFSFGRAEIERLPHLGDDVSRTTSLLPGTAANDVSATFSVHGGRRDEVMILLDGQELYEAYHLRDYDGALSIVPARALAGASLTTGAYPVAHGDRMSGVLDLRTTDPEPGRHLLFGLSVLDALASGSGTFGDGRGGWLVMGRRGTLELAADAVGDEGPRFWDAFAKGDAETRLGHLTGRFLVAADDHALDVVDEDDVERFSNAYRSTYAWATHRLAPSDRLLVETTGSWAGVERDRGGGGVEEEGGYELLDRRDLDVVGLTQAWTWDRDERHLLGFGWEARRYDARFGYRKDLDPEITVLAPFAPPRVLETRFDGRIESDHLAAWLSDRLRVGRLTARGGVRWDRHTATGDTLFSPRLALAWRAGERSVVRAAWGRFFQSQRPYELQVEDGDATLARAERSEHWVLGWETLLEGPVAALGGLEAVRLELYRREIDHPRARFENLLEPLNVFPEIEPDRVEIAPDRSLANGVELLVRGRAGARLGWWATYSWSRIEDRIGRRDVPRSLDQPHAATIDLDYRLPRDWSLNLAWRYHTGWPTTPVFGRLAADPDEPDEEPELEAVFGDLNSERLPAYHRLDLRASRTWAFARGRLTFFVDIQNVYDRQNLAGFDVEIDEDEGEVHLLPESWPGIFPSLGVTIEL